MLVTTGAPITGTMRLDEIVTEIIGLHVEYLRGYIEAEDPPWEEEVKHD